MFNATLKLASFTTFSTHNLRKKSTAARLTRYQHPALLAGEMA